LAGAVGLIGGKLWPGQLVTIKGHDAETGDEPEMAIHDEARARPTLGRALKVTAVCGVLWWLPVVAMGSWRGWDSVFVKEGVCFGKAAMVTFGGAYAVLPYVAQAAVDQYGWLAPGQMMDGLGLAETTPGLLIMVLQFVGFMGAWQHAPEGMSPLTSGVIGALMTTWATFLPCFLWIYLGAPHIERLRDRTHLTAALSAITAALVVLVRRFWSSYP
jgi:chromate transporter